MIYCGVRSFLLRQYLYTPQNNSNNSDSSIVYDGVLWGRVKQKFVRISR